MKNYRNLPRRITRSQRPKGAIAGLPIPVIANAAAEFLGMLLLPPMSKRRDEWLQGLYDSLKSLESKLAGFELEQLAKNETFVSAALQASQAAVRTGFFRCRGCFSKKLNICFSFFDSFDSCAPTLRRTSALVTGRSQ